MPLAGMTESVPSDELRQHITAQLGELEPCSSPTGNGPARYYRLPGAKGTIGFISAITKPFCSRCNRIRLTSDGKLRPCLLSDDEFDLRRLLRSNASSQELKSLMLKAIAAKPEHYPMTNGTISTKRKMPQVGG
jgi:cyclic pyranopterin phosphate synthase